MPIALFLLYFSKTKHEKGIVAIVMYLIIDFVVNVGLVFIVPHWMERYVYPLFTVIETLSFAYFYFVNFKQGTSKKMVIVLSVISSVCFLAYYSFTLFMMKYPPRIDSIPIGVESLVMIVFLLMYLFEEIKDTSTIFIYTKYSFWIAIGIVIFLAGSLFIFVYASQLPLKQVQKLWMFTNMFCIIRNLFFATAIYTLANNKNDSDSLLFSFDNLN